MRTIIYIFLIIICPVFSHAQYLGGTGNGDASIELLNIQISVHKIESEIPEKFELFQNYPNPFNPITKINFNVPKNGFVALKIYNILGGTVDVLVNQKLTAGQYSVDYNASDNPSGIYLYRLESNGYSETKKMTLIK